MAKTIIITNNHTYSSYSRSAITSSIAASHHRNSLPAKALM